MIRKKILITVQTYPTLSRKYDELVCTAGIDEEGNWYRLYPIPFRKMDYDKRFKKWSWIELDLVRKKSDPRPESYKPANVDEVKILGRIEADGKHWEERRKYVLKNVYTNFQTLIKEAKDQRKCTSLAVFKPTEVTGFKYKPEVREWNREILELIEIRAAQGDLFRSSQNPFQVVDKLPYKFTFSFKDETGKERNLMIEDWEIGQLYWNCLKQKKDEKKACEDVRKKYFENFAKTKDLYFFLGTTREHHFRGKNPFIIIGAFYPGPISQPWLLNFDH